MFYTNSKTIHQQVLSFIRISHNLYSSFQKTLQQKIKSHASMNATTLFQQFTNASHMQMLQYFPIQIQKNNFFLDRFPITT